MPEISLATLARQDLLSIGRYTQETWGQKQRDKYLKSIALVFEDLAQGTVFGKNRSDIKTGLLSHPCNRHMIFFKRDEDDNIEVLRILHTQMDFKRHL